MVLVFLHRLVLPTLPFMRVRLRYRCCHHDVVACCFTRLSVLVLLGELYVQTTSVSTAVGVWFVLVVAEGRRSRACLAGDYT